MPIYLILALATAICSTYYLVIPVVNEVINKYHDEDTKKYKYAIIILSFIAHYILAPLFIFIYLDNDMSEAFKKGLLKGLTKKI